MKPRYLKACPHWNRFNRFPVEARKAVRRFRNGVAPLLNMNRELRATPVLRLLDEGSPVDQPGWPTGVFPLLESLWPAGSGGQREGAFYRQFVTIGTASRF
jgi:hypothetical protein